MKRIWVGQLFLLAAGTSLFAQTPSASPVITAVVNSASGAPTIESGSWVSIYGTGLSTTTRAWQASDISGTKLPTTLDNVSVTINGKKAAIAYVSPGQLNVQAPTDTATGQRAGASRQSERHRYVHRNSSKLLAGVLHFSGEIRRCPAQYRWRRSRAGRIFRECHTVAAGTARRIDPDLRHWSGPHDARRAGRTAGDGARSYFKPRPTARHHRRRRCHRAVCGHRRARRVSDQPHRSASADGDQPIVATISGVSSQAAVFLPIQNSVAGNLSVTLTPNNRTIRCGATLTLTAKVSNTSNQAVTWQVNGVTGGNATVGTVSTAGVYTAPAMLPPSTAILVTAVSQQDPTAKASVTINLQNPLPVVTAVTPTPVNPGTMTITVNGTGFASGAVVYLAGVALPTTFVSNTQLTATANVAMPVGRLAAVKVTNPNPGTATSVPLAVPVRVANEKMSYADAVRFLEMTTWGPTPQSVVDLQTMGQQAWLAAQFAKPASTWPDPNNTTEGVTRLQTAFFNVALNGNDQLRQRAAFALAQILVVSAVKDTQFEQMVSYQRLMGEYAFDTYRNLLNAITLNPAMGDFLDMVNNDKANPATTSANENYARELMQLFTLGLVQLDSTGYAVLVNGGTVPEYDQATVANMAKVMTGWTYGETPGFASLWTNMPYYFGPMVAFENHHDTTRRTSTSRYHASSPPAARPRAI